jgi:DeoR family suf operon transcriptional repressor
MHSTRREVLDALTKTGRATVHQLAEATDIKPMTVRHHLTVLQADGLVVSEAKRQPVGRPYHVYSLTDKAHTLFPQYYYRLTDRLLGQLKESLPPETVQMVITALADSLAGEVRHRFENLPAEKRRAYLVEVLQHEGFRAQWQQDGDRLQLVEYYCPYYLIGQHHPEVCQIGEALIRTVLGADIQKESCLLAGDTACIFTPVDSIKEEER